MQNIIMYLSKIWNCHLQGNHEWTCAAAEGIPATREQIHGGLLGFYDYAKMYCKRCGKLSDLNRGAK